MNTSLDNLTQELRTDKITVRNKAFNQLYDILSHRASEVHQTLKNNTDISWTSLFRAAHSGLINNAEKLLSLETDVKENDPKITNYTKVVLKIVDEAPDNGSRAIPHNEIVEKVCDVLGNDGYFSLYGQCYLLVLRRAVLKPKNDLKSVNLEKWKCLLAVHFKLLKSKKCRIAFQEIMLNTQQIVDIGCVFSHLAAEIPNYLDVLLKLFERRTDTREKLELLILSYHCCRNIAVDHRFLVCQFIETISKHIHNVFMVDKKEDSKPILFKLMDLAVVVHHPSLADGRAKLEYVADEKEWKLQLRNFSYIVDQELVFQQRSGYKKTLKPELDQVFAQFAARLCYLVYWDETIWERDENGESSAKRVRHTEKLQALLEKANPSENTFNWKWLTVIAEIISNYPTALQASDFQPLLQLLADCQPSIEHDVQVYTFTKCCLVLLERENVLVTNNIIANLCRELWHKIIEGVARVCTSNNKTSLENHVLLQTLLHYQKYPSSSLIEDIIKIFLGKATVKCDVTLSTLATVMKSFNIDSLHNGKDLTMKILKYTFEKPSATDLRSIIVTSKNGKPSPKALSEVGVMCCLSKTDVFKYFKDSKWESREVLEKNWKLDLQTEYKKEISQLIRLIYVRENEKLLIEDEDFMKILEKPESPDDFPAEIKCILDISVYEELARITEFKKKSFNENSDIEEIKFYLQQVLENNEIMMNLTSTFLKLEAFNEEKFKSSFTMKNIDFHVQEIENLFELLILKGNRLELNNTCQLLIALKSLFSSSYHKKICQRVRSFELRSCLKWISKQMNNNFVTPDPEKEPMRFGEKEFINAKMEEKIKFQAIEALCSYNDVEGVDSEYAIDLVQSADMDPHDNIDLHTIFHVLNILGKQKSVSVDLSVWIWESLIPICREHNNHQYLSSKIIENLHNIVKVSNDSSEQVGDLLTVFYSFGSLCSLKQFGPHISVKYIEQFKHFHQNYFQSYMDGGNAQKVYQFIAGKFLNSEFFEIRMEAIKTLCFVLESDIDSTSEFSQMRSYRVSKKEIFNMFFESQRFKFEGSEMEIDKTADDVVVKIANSMQLFSSLFCANFVLRKPLIMELAKTVLLYQLDDTADVIFSKILKYLKCDAGSLMDTNSLVDLMTQWVNHGYVLAKFPFYLVNIKDLNTFLENYYELVVLSLLKNMVGSVDKVVDMIGLETKSVIKDLLPKCFSFMLPIEAGCLGIKYEIKAEELKAKVDHHFTDNEQLSILLCSVPSVISSILENLYDRDKFADISGVDLEVYETTEMIDFANFEKCLQHLKEKYTIPANQSLFTYFCSQKLLLHFIEKILLTAKEKIQSTRLKEHKLLYLMQYCVLVEKLFPYLTDFTPIHNETNIKGFIIREITNFLGILIVDETYGMKLREVSVGFLNVVLKKILPMCASDLKPFFIKIVQSMVGVCRKSNSNLSSKCIEIIKILVLDQNLELEEEIANLDRFPQQTEFDELRKKQLEIKYKKRKFTLVEEIEHFLGIKKRKVEGLKALREQLSTKKKELKALFDELTTTLGFAEEGASSLLHRLLRSLVDYARDNADGEERAIEAIKCLGEIGCYDLSTLSFISEEMEIYQRMENTDQCQKIICRKALDQMTKMLLHSNPQLFKSVSKACYYMLESKSSHGYEISPYLRPFSTNTVGPRSIFYDIPKTNAELNFVKTLDDPEKVRFSTYKTWIKRITASILRFVGDRVLEPVTATQKTFAENMFPMLIQLLLTYNSPSINDELISALEFFFHETSENINYVNANEDSIFLDKQAIRQMIKMAECIRVYCQDHPKSTINARISESRMKPIYLNIAKAAKYCEAFTSAVMYCELWAEMENKDGGRALSSRTLQDVLNKSLTAMGIPDASELFITPFSHRSKYLQLANLNFHNILEHDSVQSENYIKILNDMGLSFLTQKLLKADNSPNYECLWRLGKWDALLESDSETKIVDHQQEFQKFHFAGLKCLKSGDELGVKLSVNKARKATLHLIQQESLECTQNLYKFLAKSQLLQQIEDFAEFRFKYIDELRDNLIEKWKTQNQLPHDFKLIEPILTQRCMIFQTANIRAGRRSWIPGELQMNMLNIVKEAIDAGNNVDAIKTIARMRDMQGLTAANKAELLIKEAELVKDTDMNFAKHCLKRVLEEREFNTEFVLKSVAFRLYGSILADNYAEDITGITENYFNKSVKHLERYAKHHKKIHLIADITDTQASQSSQNGEVSSVVEQEDEIYQKIKENICVFDIIAKYFDREYVAKCDYVNSPDFTDKIKTYEKNVQKFDDLKAVPNKNETEKKSLVILQRSVKIDEAEIKNTRSAMKKAAGNAMYYYLRGAINDGKENILSIFRIITIWLANVNNEIIIKMLNESLPKIPTFKFIKALPQLTVRLNEKPDSSNDLLMKLVERCAIDHPHHTLPLILALVNSYADAPCFGAKEPRVVGAETLWNSLKTSRQVSSEMMKQMELMSTGLIDLANLKFTPVIPSNHSVAKLQKLSAIQCPTVDIPIMKDCNYKKRITYVLRWSKKIDAVGGVNAPKKILCYCSDGKNRSQLLKGRDDMRQDAIMQQVFSVVNQLFNDDMEMKKRHARVRTYKVVPFSRCSGILEWCDNSIPIGAYLVGDRNQKSKQGAHERYFPQDWKPHQCMMELRNHDQEKPEKKVELFKEICKKLQPVFHKFFYENFKSPGQLFERRLLYTTSVAVSSMVGYILGIGDRHVQNILIDLRTAEVVHIDFGIAFEQGKILPHPELIPFRLTRDIIAPMGVCGVDGIFRKTCEKTMKILRQNSKTLTTILEVLLYDPMFSWTSADKARRRQLDDDDDDSYTEKSEEVERDSMANRALLKIQSKLKGQADDASGYSSVERQVESLIQSATNVENLSKLYHGWQAYL